MKKLLKSLLLLVMFALGLGVMQVPAQQPQGGNVTYSTTTLKQLTREQVRNLSAEAVATIGKQYPGAVYHEYVRANSVAKSSRAIQKVQRIDYDRLMFLLLQTEQAAPQPASLSAN